MATIDGARACRMQEIIGSLKMGKPVKTIVPNIQGPRMTPLITSGQYMESQHNLVHAAQGADVVMVSVNVEVLLRHGQLLCDGLKEPIRVADSVIGPLMARCKVWIASAGTSVIELKKT